MPYVIMLMLIPTGRLFDWLRSTKKMRLITLRRIYNTIGKSNLLTQFRILITNIAFYFPKGFVVPLACNLLLMALPREVRNKKMEEFVYCAISA